ncbi:MAG TPA: hypothetical protein VJ083_09145 [Sedimentibacter sp.]|nr:hypothetical protein [Sedimentibacter sp.]
MKITSVDKIRSFSKYIMWLYVIGSAASVFIIAIIRANYASLTYDEGYSYIRYIFPLNITSFESIKSIVTDCLANNHLLNTFLCNIFLRITNIAWNDFFMRLPSLIFYGIYLIALIWMLRKKKIGIIIYSLFIFNYYLNEFFSLARGYGMATCLILFAIIMYDNWRRSKGEKLGYLSLFLMFLVLATAANTVVLLVMASFLPYVLYLLIKEKKLSRFLIRYFWSWIPLALISMWMVKFHFMVSQKGKPLYTKDDTMYKTIVKSFTGMLIRNGQLINIFALFFICFILFGFIVVVVKLIYKKEVHVNYMIPSIIFIGELVAIKYVFSFGLPTERVLLPMYPLLLFLFIDISLNCSSLYNLVNKKRIWIIQVFKRVFILLIIGFLVFNFTKNISFTTYRDWKENSNYKKLAYDAMVNPSTNRKDLVEMDYPMQYYWVKMVKDYKYDIYDGVYLQ